MKGSSLKINFNESYNSENAYKAKIFLHKRHEIKKSMSKLLYLLRPNNIKRISYLYYNEMKCSSTLLIFQYVPVVH